MTCTPAPGLHGRGGAGTQGLMGGRTLGPAMGVNYAAPAGLTKANAPPCLFFNHLSHCLVLFMATFSGALTFSFPLLMSQSILSTGIESQLGHR